MNNETQTAYFPIRELVRLTGVNASTLRAWENRHGLLRPTRTQSGHRLYSQVDVQRVLRLQELLVQGVGLADIAPLLDREVGWQNAVTQPVNGDGVWQGVILETRRALEDFSTERLDLLYNEACALYPIDLVTRNLVIPVLERLGLRWASRETGIAEEHFFSAWLRNKLGARLHHSLGLPRGRPMILACLPHESHEIGLLLCALGILQSGRRVIYLGANMPIRQMRPVSSACHAQAILVAGRDVADPEVSLRDIAWLTDAVDIPVFVGSQYSLARKDELQRCGAIPLGDDLVLGLHLIESYLASRAARHAH